MNTGAYSTWPLSTARNAPARDARLRLPQSGKGSFDGGRDSVSRLH